MILQSQKGDVIPVCCSDCLDYIDILVQVFFFFYITIFYFFLTNEIWNGQLLLMAENI